PFPYVVGPDRLLLAHLAVLGEFRQVPEVLWHRRFSERVTARRQRRAFFPGRRPPWHAYVPWWLVRGAILAWRYGVHGAARPGLPIIAYSVVFAGIFGAKAPNGIPYLVFLLFGMQGWHLFQSTVVFETRSFQRLGKFARSLNVPLLFLPTAAVSRALVNFGVY